MMINYLEEKIKKILLNKFTENEVELFSLTKAPAHVKADFSTNFALILAKKLKKTPEELAKDLVDLLLEHKIEAFSIGGFVNIKIDNNLLFDFVSRFLSDEYYFINPKNQEKKVIIEFVSANPTGPLHLASGSAATLGDSLSNIMKICGYKVHKEYYVNDTGNQIKMLGLSLKARFLNQPVPENGYNGLYLKEIAEQLPDEAKDWEDERFSQFAIEKILSEQKKDLEDFGVVFDRWFRESELHQRKLPELVLKKLKDAQMVYEKDGALWFGVKNSNEDDKDRVLVKSDGSNTYFLNDIAYHLDKYERGFNWIIDIWGADHHGYIPRMKAAIEALGKDKETFTVLIHQLVSIKKGQKLLKMSKRAGELITLRELFEDIGVDAARFFFSSRCPNTHLIFDLELARKKSNENPVYYVQYVHARINAIFENAIEKGINIDEKINYNYQLNEEEKNLLIKVLWLERVLATCIKDLSCHHLNTYLIELSGLFHSFYDKYKVIDLNNLEQTKTRLFIIKAVQKAIKIGLNLLGVSAPLKM